MTYVHRDCRVVRDPQTLKSKGYGFVSFVKKSVSIKRSETLSFFEGESVRLVNALQLLIPFDIRLTHTHTHM